MSPQPKVSMNDEMMDWLKETYPGAMSDAERVRMAIQDARNAREERVEAKALVEEHGK